MYISTGKVALYISTGKVALPMVPVRVYTPGSNREVTTYALIETGSTSSFCQEDLLARLGVKGERDIFNKNP